MRFFRRYTPNMLQLVSNQPAIDKSFWSVELWKHGGQAGKFICEGSLDIQQGRRLAFGFGNRLSLRYYEDLAGRHIILWLCHRGLVFYRKRSRI